MTDITKKTVKKIPEEIQEGNIIERAPDGTIELKMVLPWAVIKKEWDLVIEEMAKSANLPGFRKGKAPAKLVEEKIDKAKVKDEVLKKLLPVSYAQAIKTHNIKPIIDPQIHVDGELAEGKDWQLHAITCEFPEISLGDYKTKIKAITAKGKIEVPGKEAEAPKFEDVIGAVLEASTVKIPGVLIQREADRLISQMLDEIKRLGMNLDQYLASSGKNPEDLRAEYAKKAERDLKLEFVLQKIAQDEKITVDEAEIQKTIDGAKPEEKASLQTNKYLLASIIRQQKTLDFLKSL